ncbi:Vacuolar protein sorting-associated protein 29 [Paramecium bursaria]
MTQELNYGDLVLVCGDIYLGTRSNGIPNKLKNLLQNKVQHLIFTGNSGDKDSIEWLKSIYPTIHQVRGQYDDDDIPENKFITIGTWKFFITHGHQIVPWGDEETLSIYMKEQDADIAIYGNLHEQKVSKLDKKYFLSPGSITGVYGGMNQNIRKPIRCISIQVNQQ